MKLSNFFNNKSTVILFNVCLIAFVMIPGAVFCDDITNTLSRDMIEIVSAEQLSAVCDNLYGAYCLGADIDLSGYRDGGGCY